jgi:hypothetical protein
MIRIRVVVGSKMCSTPSRALDMAVTTLKAKQFATLYRLSYSIQVRCGVTLVTMERRAIYSVELPLISQNRRFIHNNDIGGIWHFDITTYIKLKLFIDVSIPRC